MRTTSTLIALALLLITTTARAADDAPMSVASWVDRLQAIAAKHKGGTTLENRTAFRAFAKEIGTQKIEFTSIIYDVDWENGVATITTQRTDDTLAYTTAAAPLSLRRGRSFALRMTEAQAWR